MMRIMVGCCFGYLFVDFCYISIIYVNNCIKVNVFVSIIDLMRVINIILFFLGIVDFVNYCDILILLMWVEYKNMIVWKLSFLKV